MAGRRQAAAALLVVVSLATLDVPSPATAATPAAHPPPIERPPIARPPIEQPPRAAPSQPSSRAPPPLLEYALSTTFATMAGESELRRTLAVAESELRRQDVPDEDCAHTLGAARFAALLADVADARAATGDTAGAIEALHRALDCAPRTAWLLAGLANALASQGRIDAAREAARRGLAISPENARLNDALAQLEFIAGDSAAAEPYIGKAIERNGESTQAAYWRLLLHLAQRRAASMPEAAQGDDAPSAAADALDAADTLEEWPLPLLDLFRGRATERDVLQAITDERSERRRREMLCEALFYVGELRLTEGARDLARRYFAAAVNVKVPYFVEHRLARTELALMRAAAAAQAAAKE